MVKTENKKFRKISKVTDYAALTRNIFELNSYNCLRFINVSLFSLSFCRHFQNRKEFSSGVPHKPGVEEISGVTTLADYQTQEKTDKYIEEMKGYGLTVDEIFLKLQNEETDFAVRNFLKIIT